MASLGKSINLYLMDGDASGRWQATLSNWNGTAYKIPRSQLKKCFTDLPELSAPGVYFLFGRDDATGRQFIYVGEADDVLKRLSQPHTFEKDDSYWTEAVAFVTPDGTLEKGRVKYLENRFYTMAKDADRYLVKNGNRPTRSPMPKQIRDLLEEFIINAKLVVPALGHMAFVPLKSPKSEKRDNLLYFSRNGLKATGKLSSDGFWVLKGSCINPEVADYTLPGVKRMREQYAELIGPDGNLTDDLLFGSPSFASTFVCGKNSNGLAEWKDKNGVSLKELDSYEPKRTRRKKEPVSNENQSNRPEIFHLAGKKVSAIGWLTDNGFVVGKGSDFYPDETKSLQEQIRKKRTVLLAQGKVKDGIFTEDVLFNSPSAAGAVITGSSVNGNEVWLNAEGKKLKEVKGK